MESVKQATFDGLPALWHNALCFKSSPETKFYSGAIIKMSENGITEHAEPQKGGAAESHQDEVTYHAVEKDGKITAIWEMRGRKHVRTIDPRSAEGRHLLGHTDNPETVQSAQV
jgi:hypothetical protein